MDRKKILDRVRGRVHFGRLFKDRTYFKIGGPARIWIEPIDLEDLHSALHLSKRLKLPVLLFGSGSNMLVDDRAIEKAVVQLSSRAFKKIKFSGDEVVCGSGLALSSLVRNSVKKGLGGLEPLAGIPGTVGGALAMNAGGPEAAIGKFLKWVKVMDRRGRLKELKADAVKFTYRKSGLSGKIILEAAFKLKKSDPRLLKKRFAKFLDKKNQTQEFGYPSAGCIFKNTASSKWTTGRLMDAAGLKGRRIGDAQISAKHANFIINRGKATSGDVRRLMRLTQGAVKKRFGVWLEPEVRIIR